MNVNEFQNVIVVKGGPVRTFSERKGRHQKFYNEYARVEWRRKRKDDAPITRAIRVNQAEVIAQLINSFPLKEARIMIKAVLEQGQSTKA